MTIKGLVTLFIAGALVWLLHYSMLERTVDHEDYDYSSEQARALRHMPEAMYDYGLDAWIKHKEKEARGFFSRAVGTNVLFVDAWLRLARAEASLGRQEKAEDILAFTRHLTGDILKWQWDQLLLAHETGLEGLFFEILNELVSEGRFLRDAFQLLDIHAGTRTRVAIKGLRPGNLPDYLKWLMRWNRADEARAVWREITETIGPDPEIKLDYLDFLIRNKRIDEAVALRPEKARGKGLTNPGFEHEITRRGFDWRYRERGKGRWEISRVEASSAIEGSHVLCIGFGGQENVSFHHLYQIVPVSPGVGHGLGFWWKSEDLTTDKRPFVEIYGYDKKGLYEKTPMIGRDSEWHEAFLEFTPPEGCSAVVVRLRRKRSHHFDCKIAGSLCLDNFRLETMDPKQGAALKEQ